MKFLGTLLTIFAVFIAPITFAEFPDVKSTHPQHTAITTLQEKKIIGGYPNGNFYPEKTINRAEFLKIVVGAKYDNTTIEETPFNTTLSDVKKEDWFARYISFALQHAIVNGYGDKTFKPANTINLAEALKIIIEAYHLPKTFSTGSNPWYQVYLETAHTHQLLMNVVETRPTTFVTRGDVAQMIYNALYLGTTASHEPTYKVVEVIDGDTIVIEDNGKTERVRFIGVDTPETVHPSKPVECFGKEASEKTKALLLGKQVTMVSDPSQGLRDKYDRLLSYIFLDNVLINQTLIEEGYGFEYTYTTPYQYQEAFKNVEQEAKNQQKGLWNPTACPDTVTNTSSDNTQTTKETQVPTQCTIKGNMSSSGEKIYHMQGCGSYGSTKIDESKGERWFCTPEEAEEAGWRKAKNCG